MRATGEANWATIDELDQRLERVGYWDLALKTDAIAHLRKSHIRRKIRQQKDSKGWRLFASIKTVNSEGKAVRVYKQEILFDREDYRQVTRWWSERTRYCAVMTAGYAKNAKHRYRMQIALPFDVDSFTFD